MSTSFDNSIKAILFVLTLCFSSTCYAQDIINWHILADAEFESTIDQETGIALYKVIPGNILSTYDNQEVIISGYVIPMDALGISFALSRTSFASCFFCGNAGPETVIQLRLQPSAYKKYETDTKAKFKGILKINPTNENSFNYELLQTEEI